MNRLHIKRMSQNKGNSFLTTEVREPIPGKHTLDADDEILAIGSNHPQKCVRSRRQIFMDEFRTVLIEKTDLHRPRM